MMQAGPAAEPGEDERGRRLQQSGDQHSAAESGGLGQLHQRSGTGLARNLRLHPSPSARAVRAVLFGGRNAAGRGLLGNRRPPPAARFLALQSPAARDGPAPAGRSVLGLPRRGRHPVDVLRLAVQLSAQSVAVRTSPLHLRHGDAGHAGNLRHLPVLQRGRSGGRTRRRRRHAHAAGLRQTNRRRPA